MDPLNASVLEDCVSDIEGDIYLGLCVAKDIAARPSPFLGGEVHKK